MAIRQSFFRWLGPSALVLPVWLLVGFFVFQGNAWGILWLLFIAMPAVFVGQLIFTLLVRSRASVARTRAVSWLDIAAFSTWHVLTILVGLYSAWFPLFLTLAIVAAVGVLVSCLWQLWHEATGVRRVQVDGDGHIFAQAPPAPSAPTASSHDDVFIVSEKPAN